jgi:hypothetical protein
MKCRQLSFYVETPELGAMMTAVRDRVIPGFESLPHFLGMTVIKCDIGPRSQVFVTSFWDDGLEGSNEASARFIEEIVETTGRNPSRTAYDTLYAEVRNSSGVFGVHGMQWEGRPRNRPMGVEAGRGNDGALNGSRSTASAG